MFENIHFCFGSIFLVFGASQTGPEPHSSIPEQSLSIHEEIHFSNQGPRFGSLDARLHFSRPVSSWVLFLL